MCVVATLMVGAAGLRVDSTLPTRSRVTASRLATVPCMYAGEGADTTTGPENKLAGRIFCNRALNMDQIQAIGFDLDYTLAEYKPAFDLLAYNGALQKLLAMGYPAEIQDLKYDGAAYQRGLVIDKRRGNLVKLDRHKYPKVVYHGLTKIDSASRKALYSRSFEAQPQFSPPDYVSVDTEFQLVDVCLFCQLVDIKDRMPERVPQSYTEIYKQVRRAVDLCHCDGVIKNPVAVDPATYIKASPDLPRMLKQLMVGGKQVFLLTNSLYDYTNVVCTYLLGEQWLDFFDLVICGARKPGFLLDPYLPIFRVSTEDASLENIELGSEGGAAAALAAGKVFQGGNWNHLHRMLNLQTGSALMYVGDHMYSDILRSKRTLGWRTLLIVPELYHEVSMLEESEAGRRRAQTLREARASLDLQLRRLQLKRLTLNQEGAKEADIAALDDEEDQLYQEQSKLTEQLSSALEARHEAFHPRWGQLFKAGHQNSRWAQQVGDYACLYTSQATNLQYATSNTAFRALTDLMPHDRAAIEAFVDTEMECVADAEGEVGVGADADAVQSATTE